MMADFKKTNSFHYKNQVAESLSHNLNRRNVVVNIKNPEVTSGFFKKNIGFLINFCVF